MRRLQAVLIYGRAGRVARLLVAGGLCFFAGVAAQRHYTRPVEVEAQSDHLYELMVYHVLPGKALALESVFQGVSQLQAKHGLNSVGFWVPNEDSPAWKNTFVYLLVHSDRQSAEANWKAFHADPTFEPYFKAAAPLIQQKDGIYQVDEIYMDPTSYSASK